jgi:hypothetical protein
LPGSFLTHGDAKKRSVQTDARSLIASIPLRRGT